MTPQPYSAFVHDDIARSSIFKYLRRKKDVCVTPLRFFLAQARASACETNTGCYHDFATSFRHRSYKIIMCLTCVLLLIYIV